MIQRHMYYIHYTELITLAFLYQFSIGLSPDIVSVSSKHAQPLKNSSCFITRVSFPVNALYMSSITAKSVGNRISNKPCFTYTHAHPSVSRLPNSRRREGGETYKRRADRNTNPPVARLDNGGIHTVHGIGQRVEITQQQPVRRKTLSQHVEKRHQHRGHELRFREVRGKWEAVAQAAEEGAGSLHSARGRDAVPDAKEALRDGVQEGGVELEEVARGVDHDVALQDAVGGVVAEHVVREVVGDLEGEEEAGLGHEGGPVEDAFGGDFDFRGVPGESGGCVLLGCEAGADLDDAVFGARVDVGVGGADVVENVGHHGPVAGAQLVDYQVVVGEERELVVFDKVATDGFAVVRLEELGGGVPELAGVGGVGLVEGVFEGGIAGAEEGLEGGFVGEGIEGEGSGGGEDDGSLGKIAIVRVIEGVWSRRRAGGGGERRCQKIHVVPVIGLQRVVRVSAHRR